jgi:hypothetical protein
MVGLLESERGPKGPLRDGGYMYCGISQKLTSEPERLYRLSYSIIKRFKKLVKLDHYYT